MDKLNDIEPIIDSGFGVVVYISVALTLSMLFVLLYLFFKYRKKGVKKANPYESLDFGKPSKELIYNFTKIAKTQEPKEGLNELLKELQEYKYSPNAKEVDKEIVDKIREYIENEEL